MSRPQCFIAGGIQSGHLRVASAVIRMGGSCLVLEGFLDIASGGVPGQIKNGGPMRPVIRRRGRQGREAVKRLLHHDAAAMPFEGPHGLDRQGQRSHVFFRADVDIAGHDHRPALELEEDRYAFISRPRRGARWEPIKTQLKV